MQVDTDLYHAYHAGASSSSDRPPALTVHECVQHLMQRIQHLQLCQSGTFWQYDGKVLPW